MPMREDNRELLRLAEAAGIVIDWRDAHGLAHRVREPVVRRMLDVLRLESGTPAQIGRSLRQLDHDARRPAGDMVIAEQGMPIVFRHDGAPGYRVELEDGQSRSGVARNAGPGVVAIPSIDHPGYHRLAIGDTSLCLAVCPGRGPSVAELTCRRRARAWGLAVQVGSLSRKGPDTARGGTGDRGDRLRTWPGWAVGGDYGALAELAGAAARQGASALAISPVHAMFSADPWRYSPYSPSSRLFLNAAYIDPSSVLGEAAVRSALAAMHAQPGHADTSPPLVDWPRIVPMRLALLRCLFTRFHRHRPAGLFERFMRFRRRGGRALEDHARYEALHADPAITPKPQNGWRDWPAALRDPAGPAVGDYAEGHAMQVGFHVFLQWLADEGMRRAQHSARDAGMPIGLVADMAIGSDPRGSHAWSRQADILPGACVGAPPDLYQPQGQYWGLTAFSPHALRGNGYAPFIDVLRASLAHAGAVRIDHILGMARMWLVPEGEDPAQGCYVRYPLDDMLRLTVLEAWRHNALVIGENLGTVPEGFNRRIEERGILGTAVLWFERNFETDRGVDAGQEPGGGGADACRDGAEADARSHARAAPFKKPAQWQPCAVAMPSTHDLPTLEGWWRERDLWWRERLGHAPDGQAACDRLVRRHDKKALWRALHLAGRVSGDAAQPPEQTPRDAILAFVAGTPGPLAMIPMEDLLGLADQPNMPGTGAEAASHDRHAPRHPNWMRALPLGVDEIFSDEAVRRSVAAIIEARGTT